MFTIKSYGQQSEQNLLHTILTYLWLLGKKKYLKNLTFNPTFGCGIEIIFSAYGLKDLNI